MIYSQIKQGRTLKQIERSITLRIRRLVISATLLGMLVGCVIGVIIRTAQVDPIIREAEADRALLSQLQREKLVGEEWQRHIIVRQGGGKGK